MGVGSSLWSPIHAKVDIVIATFQFNWKCYILADDYAAKYTTFSSLTCIALINLAFRLLKEFLDRNIVEVKCLCVKNK